MINRRDLITAAASVYGAAALETVRGEPAPAGTPAQSGPADYTLEIGPAAIEVAPSHFVSTVAYNGTAPGPLLRMREGRPVTIDVINDSQTAELVHWHGLFVPSEIDGVEEEGTPLIPPGARRRYRFTPRPAGTRWYHSHAMAMGDLNRSTYTGQFGFLLVDSGADPGQYDQEVFLALREWEPFYTDQPMDTDDQDTRGPQPERPATLDTRPNGLEATSQLFSINDKALGFGEPLRVRQGARVLLHLLNASALENRTIALPGHEFQVLALDGNPVPRPGPAKVITLGPGERVDAFVEMNAPGVWILGSTFDPLRTAGLGIVVEYANHHREPRWVAQPGVQWDYTAYGHAPGQAPPRPTPDHTIEMLFEKVPSGAAPFNLWTVNGKPYPHANEFVLDEGRRYRILFRNRSDDAHPLHLHRHTFELVDVNGRPTSGVMKDTVIIPVYGRVTVDLVADQPGLSLFHCHIQQHMDFGFKALFRYA
ncbi:MAG TPA: multicopper oxidase domain-containing protein [Steroidobacteraceae bacterium]|nr:multicopper oxidase domain-containing protein [Steroidobacteraceae bacterium]